jgi:hypothetical protein
MDTVSISRQEAASLLATIDQVSTVIKSVDFKVVYAFTRTKSSLQAEIDAMNASQKPSDAFMAFNTAREELCKTYAIQEGGEPKVIATANGGSAYDIDPDRREDFDQKLIELRAKHKIAIDEESKRIEGINEWLKERIDVQIHRLPSSSFSTTGLTLQQVMHLLPMFSDAPGAEGNGAAPLEPEVVK